MFKNIYIVVKNTQKHKLLTCYKRSKQSQKIVFSYLFIYLFLGKMVILIETSLKDKDNFFYLKFKKVQPISLAHPLTSNARYNLNYDPEGMLELICLQGKTHIL